MQSDKPASFEPPLSYFDSHAHLTSPTVAPGIDPILQRALQARVTHILNICTDKTSLHEGILLAKRYHFLRNAGATTPHDVAKEGEADFSHFAHAAKTGLLALVGETGLDYHYEHSPKEIQKRFLIRYLHLAAETKLPVVFHCREAFADLFSIADLEYPKRGLAVLHCFTGTLQEAEQVIQRGWFLSLSGIVTFKKSEELREVAKMVPLEQLLIETDAPFLAPQSHRGKPNEPSFLPEIAACIAKVKGVPLEIIARATWDNAAQLAKIPREG